MQSCLDSVTALTNGEPSEAKFLREIKALVKDDIVAFSAIDPSRSLMGEAIIELRSQTLGEAEAAILAGSICFDGQPFLLVTRDYLITIKAYTSQEAMIGSKKVYARSALENLHLSVKGGFPMLECTFGDERLRFMLLGAAISPKGLYEDNSKARLLAQAMRDNIIAKLLPGTLTSFALAHAKMKPHENT